MPPPAGPETCLAARLERLPRAAVPSPTPAGSFDAALRAIAVFEGFKALLAIAATFGLLSLMHRDLHAIVETLIGRIGLDPDGRYPTMLLDRVDWLMAADIRQLVLAAVAYVTVRLAEGWGLWHDRSWGEWPGALSSAL